MTWYCTQLTNIYQQITDANKKDAPDLRVHHLIHYPSFMAPYHSPTTISDGLQSEKTYKDRGNEERNYYCVKSHLREAQRYKTT